MFQNENYTIHVSSGGTPYNGSYGEAPPERGALLGFSVYGRVEKFAVSVCLRFTEIHLKLKEITAKSK